MKEPKIITLDLTGCKYLGEVHERIGNAFAFPEWYGENWNAFYDLLWSECDADKVKVIGECTLPAEFKQQIAVMHQVLEDFKKNCLKYNDFFEYEIIS